MNDRSTDEPAGSSVPGRARQTRSGRVPSLTADFITPRNETGHGLDIGADFVGGMGGDRPAMTILTGPSGYGKTHLATALLARLAHSGASDVQLWINGSSKWAMMAGYAQAASDIGVSHRGVKLDAGVSRFQQWLDSTDARWVAVYDNVTDFSALAELLPTTLRGQVLVTCGRPIHAADIASLAGIEPEVCHITEFSPREALNYVAGRLQHDGHDRVEAVDLATDLGCMPLALKLATATIAGSTLDCRNYRGRFATRSHELAEITSGRLASLAAPAVSLAMDLADRHPPVGLARAVLALIALLDPRGVPLQVPMSKAGCGYLAVHTRTSVEQSDVWAALVTLTQGGLANLDRSSAVPMITVHPDVQAAVRTIVPGSALAAGARAAADSIGEVLPQLSAEPSGLCALASCVTALCGLAGDLPWVPAPHAVIARTGERIAAASLWGSAIDYWQSLLNSNLRFLGPSHVQTLATRESLASSLQAAARFADAIALTELSIAERERLQGPGHPDTLTARSALAQYHRGAGRLDLAIEAGERVLAERLRMLGTNHRETLAARSQLAGTFRVARQFDQAITLYQQNLAEWMRLLGADHTETVAEYTNLGRTYQSAGRPEDAITVFRKVRAVKEQSLGAGHPESLAVCSYLAAAYQGAGKMKDAIDCYRRTLAGRQAALGPDHPDSLTAMSNLASCYHAAHRLKDAIPLYERLLADRERVQGPEHPDTLTARGNLAGAYHSAGRLADALPLYELTVADFERVLGRDHRDTLTARSNLAHAYHMARRREKSLEVFESVLADCEHALGPDDPLTVAIRENYVVASQLSSLACVA
jgi:tetratricopeptide (TPR) repeat protein